MAQQVIQLDREKLSCSICLDLLKDPVTIPCGHSYCMSCIKDCWNEEKEKETHSCPQCRQSFTPRPDLVKNTILAELVEELKKTGPQAASPVGPEDVACDFCSGAKVRAFKSCLMCMASYCEQHLQPHYTVAPLKKHKLVEATLKLQESICSRHDEVMKIFCRTDQQSICYLCSMDDHKGHNTVSAAAERAERQVGLGVTQQKIQQRIQDTDDDIELLQQRVEAINRSADEAVRNSDKIFTEMISAIEKRRSEVKQQITSRRETEVSRAEEVQEKLQQQLTKLKRKDAELEKLSGTEDHLHFLNTYPSLSHLSQSEDVPSIDVPQRSFEHVTAMVSKARDNLLAVLSDEWAKISGAVTEVDVLVPQAEPKTRDDFMRYLRQISLDPNTANKRLFLTDSNRKVELMSVNWFCFHHPDRFLTRHQVLSEEGLTGRCYWEVKLSGLVYVAVAYKDIRRTGNTNESGFGLNDKSWALKCKDSGYEFKHNNISMSISGPQSSKIGVYLDHSAGTLSFYNVSETMTLLHRVQTTFTQPLYAGFWLLSNVGGTAELCEFKE